MLDITLYPNHVFLIATSATSQRQGHEIRKKKKNKKKKGKKKETCQKDS